MKDFAIAALRDVPSLERTVPPEDWRARVDLAALHHLVHRLGWNDGIGNHAAARVPGAPGRMLIKPDALLWDEVTASNLIEVEIDGDCGEASHGVNRPGFVLHSTMLRARPDAAVTLHLHPDACVVIAGLKGGILPLSRDAIRFVGRIGYHPYTGASEGPEECALIAQSLGDHAAMLMRGHGAVTVGPAASYVFKLMASLITACETQMRMMATGDELVLPAAAVWQTGGPAPKAQETPRDRVEWAGWLRMLDRTGAGYRR
jgi:ribulose-5-phosphate 4-epimerase/fuculose-1-phosphate aldolase